MPDIHVPPEYDKGIAAEKKTIGINFRVPLSLYARRKKVAKRVNWAKWLTAKLTEFLDEMGVPDDE